MKEDVLLFLMVVPELTCTAKSSAFGGGEAGGGRRELREYEIEREREEIFREGEFYENGEGGRVLWPYIIGYWASAH